MHTRAPKRSNTNYITIIHKLLINIIQAADAGVLPVVVPKIPLVFTERYRRLSTTEEDTMYRNRLDK